MSKLSEAQKKFIASLQSGKTPSRKPNDKTGKSLEKLGLVKFAIMVGWVATAAGFQLNVETGEAKS